MRRPHDFLQATVNDPPGAPPDPSRIIVKLPNQIKWTGNEALVYGDPTKPGDPYGVAVKLAPGQFSQPHTLANDRWGLWSLPAPVGQRQQPLRREFRSYPVKADNFITNLAKATFSDGNRAGATEPTVLIITGVGSPDNRIMSDYAQTTSVKVSDPAGAGARCVSHHDHPGLDHQQPEPLWRRSAGPDGRNALRSRSDLGAGAVFLAALPSASPLYLCPDGDLVGQLQHLS